jgi:hypothetical protein
MAVMIGADRGRLPSDDAIDQPSAANSNAVYVAPPANPRYSNRSGSYSAPIRRIPPRIATRAIGTAGAGARASVAYG